MVVVAIVVVLMRCSLCVRLLVQVETLCMVDSLPLGPNCDAVLAGASTSTTNETTDGGGGGAAAAAANRTGPIGVARFSRYIRRLGAFNVLLQSCAPLMNDTRVGLLLSRVLCVLVDC